MEDLEPVGGSPASSPIPEAGNDPQDPLRPDLEEENETNPPISAPTQDIDAVENKDELSDDAESELSEIDEAQFEDFDPAAVAIEDRPVAVDEGNLSLLGVHKRKRADGDEEPKKKKKKEGRREKTRKNKRVTATEDIDFADGEEVDGKRSRKRKDNAEKSDRPRVRRSTPENEDDLSPEERRKRALDRAMDEALKNPNRRRGRRADGIDLETANDELIENMRRRMTEAAKADTDARQAGQPAMQKLKMLPEVVALLNRNNLKQQLVDPDINLLEAVRFFLEPLDDGSLPAYNIQRELFAALSRLPINKDALVASGIGKVTLFYTKSQKPEANIKRRAEKLLGEWTRPILKRSDDYRKRELQEAVYDPRSMPIRSESSQVPSENAAAAAAAAARERKLAPPTKNNRARIEGGLSSYTIAPRNNLSNNVQFARPMGSTESDIFRRMKMSYKEGLPEARFGQGEIIPPASPATK